jgi:hypothetical protein
LRCPTGKTRKRWVNARSRPTIGEEIKHSSGEMRRENAVCVYSLAVIARLDRAIQYSETL